MTFSNTAHESKQSLNENSLLNILCTMEGAVAIYSGEEILIELANPAMLAAWGRSSDVIGKTLSDALPEIANQPFLKMLQHVWRSGIDDVGEAIPAELVVDGKLQVPLEGFYNGFKNGPGSFLPPFLRLKAIEAINMTLWAPALPISLRP